MTPATVPSLTVSLPLPAPLDVVQAFLDHGARLGAELLDVTVHPGGMTEIWFQVQMDRLTGNPVPADPMPVEVTAAAATSTSPPSPKAAPGPGLTGSKPGTTFHRVLTIVADAGGTFEGSRADLARELDGPSLAADSQAVAKLCRIGLLHAPAKRGSGPVSLTGDGWRRIGRSPSNMPAQNGMGRLTDTPAPTVSRPPLDLSELEPVGSGRFDPDEARTRAAAAL